MKIVLTKLNLKVQLDHYCFRGSPLAEDTYLRQATVQPV